jgi:hypothetical protein
MNDVSETGSYVYIPLLQTVSDNEREFSHSLRLCSLTSKHMLVVLFRK